MRLLLTDDSGGSRFCSVRRIGGLSKATVPFSFDQRLVSVFSLMCM